MASIVVVLFKKLDEKNEIRPEMAITAVNILENIMTFNRCNVI